MRMRILVGMSSAKNAPTQMFQTVAERWIDAMTDDIEKTGIAARVADCGGHSQFIGGKVDHRHMPHIDIRVCHLHLASLIGGIIGENSLRTR